VRIMICDDNNIGGGKEKVGVGKERLQSSQPYRGYGPRIDSPAPSARCYPLHYGPPGRQAQGKTD